MNKKVLTTDQSNCGCDVGTGLSIQQPANPADSIIVRNAPGITNGNVINEYEENGKKIYELDDLEILGPLVAFSNNAPAITEIGATIATVTFSGNITQRTYPISSRTITPDPGGLDLTAPFNFQKLNVKRTSPGVAENHTLQAIDNQGLSASLSAGVNFKHAFYQGFSDLATLTQAQIKALVNKTLNDSVIQQYGGQKSYAVPASPAVPKYIYWCFPVGTQAIAGLILNGLTLPFTILASVDVTNIHDGSIVTPYVVVRTSEKLDPGTYLITAS